MTKPKTVRHLVSTLRFFIVAVPLCGVVSLMSTFPAYVVRSWAQATTLEAVTPTPAAPTTPAAQTTTSQASSGQAFWDWVKGRPGGVIAGALIAAIIIVGGGALLYKAFKAGPNPKIQQLGPSFFFWLGMMYTGLLLLLGAIYNLTSLDPRPTLVGGILPIAVPWFGALGGVTISLEGVFLWNTQWDKKYNYWHIGRPLFGAVLGIIAFFLFVVIGAAAGTPPKFLDSTPTGAKDIPPLKDFIIYYVVAFLVGYREETFRELIKRVTDLILKPGTQATSAPAVTFRIAGVAQQEIQCPDVAAGQPPSSRTVEVQNTGNAPLIGPTVTIAPIAPTAAGTFAMANDLVTGGGDLAPGEARTVDVTFAPLAAGRPDFAATLTVTATNLPEPKTIRVIGHRA